MRSSLVYAALSILLSVSVAQAQNTVPSPVKLATTGWCPYSCIPNTEKPGIAQEYIRALFAKHDLTIEISSYPWNRAIEIAEAGQLAHGLLTAVHSEAPSFLFSSQPIMTYQVCFYGRKDQSWKYENTSTLHALPGKLGVIASYGYGDPLDQFLAGSENKSRILKLRGQNPLQRLIKLLISDRIQILVADRNIVRWLKTSSPQPEIHSLFEKGCLSERPFFIAFNSKLRWPTPLLKILDREFADPRNQSLREQISKTYLGPAAN